MNILTAPCPCCGHDQEGVSLMLQIDAEVEAKRVAVLSRAMTWWRDRCRAMKASLADAEAACEEAMQERDDREDKLGEIAEGVFCREWSSSYGFDSLVHDVKELMENRDIWQRNAEKAGERARAAEATVKTFRESLAWIATYAHMVSPAMVEIRAQNALADAGFEASHRAYGPRPGSPEEANMALVERCEAAEAERNNAQTIARKYIKQASEAISDWNFAIARAEAAEARAKDLEDAAKMLMFWVEYEAFNEKNCDGYRSAIRGMFFVLFGDTVDSILAGHATAPSGHPATATVSAREKRLEEALQAYAQFEAELVMDRGSWSGPTGHPFRTDDLLDQFMECQRLRNAALAAESPATFAPDPQRSDAVNEAKQKALLAHAKKAAKEIELKASQEEYDQCIDGLIAAEDAEIDRKAADEVKP